MRTSFGTGMPRNGLLVGNSASALGWPQLMTPPSARSPSRSGVGTSVSPPAARLGPAKRTATPPRSIHLAISSRSLAEGAAPSGISSTAVLRVSTVSRSPMRQADIGIERALEEVDLLQQRLAGGGGALAQDRDGPAAVALVEQHGAAGAALRLDVEAGHAVAQLGRRRQHAFALGRGGGEVELDAGDDAALVVGRLDRRLARPVGDRAQRASP